MSFIDDQPNMEIVTSEQARNWILEQIDLLAKVRMGCCITFPGEKAKTVEFQTTAYRKFLTRHGGVLGMLAVLYRCQKIDKDTYGDLRADTMALLGPSDIADRYDWFSRIESGPITEEQARAWVEDQVELLTHARLDCNVIYPNNPGLTVEYQKMAERCLLVKHGCVLGMLVAFLRCRKLSDVAYSEFQAKAMAVLVPTLVGEASAADFERIAKG